MKLRFFIQTPAFCSNIWQQHSNEQNDYPTQTMFSLFLIKTTTAYGKLRSY